MKRTFLNMIMSIKQQFSKYSSIKLIKMGQVNELNIKNQIYYLFDDMIQVLRHEIKSEGAKIQACEC